jgi:hypothetical protein
MPSKKNKTAGAPSSKIYIITTRPSPDGRQLASSGGEDTVEMASKAVRAQFKKVSAMAGEIKEELSKLKTSEIEVKFGVKLGGKAGIPFVTEGSVDANFEVTMKWKLP